MKKISPNENSAPNLATSIGNEAKPHKVKGEGKVSILEYRQMLCDDISTDEQITRRLRYLEALCRNVIQNEIQKYVQKNKKQK